MATLIPNFDLAKTIGDRIELDVRTVGDLVQEGIARFGEPFKKEIESVAIIVNGRSVNHLRGRKTRLRDGDMVWLVRPSSGG